MNKQQSIDFIKQTQTLVTDIVDRNRVIACAVAVALVKKQDIPSSPVEDPAAHYITNISPRLRQYLSDFNEGVVFDIRYAVEVARSLWMLRYYACHGSTVSMFKPEYSFIENFTAGSMTIPEDVKTLLNKHQSSIGLLAAFATNIFAETAAGMTVKA